MHGEVGRWAKHWGRLGTCAYRTLDSVLFSGGRRVEDILYLVAYLTRFHATKCDCGERVGLEAGVCGEVDNVHKHLFPPKLF